MQGPGTSGTEPVKKEVGESYTHKTKLERVDGKHGKYKNAAGDLDGAWTEWKTIFDATKDSIMVIDNHSRITQANLATSSFLGKPLEEVIGKTCWQTVHGTNKPPKGCPLKKALSSGKHEEAELYIQEKDIWIEISTDPVLDDKGKTSSVVHIIRDITGRRRAEEALRKSEEQHRAIFRGAMDGIVYADRRGRVIDVNPAFTRITGIPREKVAGKSGFNLARQFAKPKDIPHLLKAVRQALKGEPIELYELEINNKVVEVSTPSLRSEQSGITGVIRDITERKKAEKILQDSEEKYRSIFENIVDVYYRADLEGNLILFSPSGARLLGYDSMDDLEGKNLVKDFYYHPEDREIFQKELIKHGRVVNYKVTLRRKDGTPVLGETNSHLVYDRTGRAIAVEGIFRDISDRIRTEESLRESEKRFRGIFENSLIGMYRTTPDGRILMANPALVRMLGYTSFEELATRNLEQHGFEPDYPRSQFKRRIEAEGRVIGLESAWRRRDGTTLYVRESAQAICDGSVNTLYYQGTVEDVTERKKAEEALRASENRLGLAIECTGLGLWDQDFQTGRVTRNDNWMTMLGYEPDEISPDRQSFHELIHPDDVLRFEQCTQDHEAGRTSVFDVEIRMRTRSGRWRWIRNFGRIVKRDEDDRPLRAVGVHLDITERKKAEEAIKASEFRYRELFNHMNSGVAVFASRDEGEDFIFTDFNMAGERIDNIKKEDLIGKSVVDVFPGVKEFGLFDVIQNVWKTGAPRRHPVSLYKDDRLVGWRENYVYKLPSGEIVAVYKDLTDSVKAEKAIRESEAQLRRAQEVAHVGSWHLDLRTDRLTWSDETYRIFGVPIEQPLMEADFQSLVYPDDLSYVKQSWAAALEGEPYDIEHRIAVAGGVKWVHEKAVLEFDAEGKPLSGIGTVQDITERKRAEAALRESEQKYRELFENAREAIVIIDMDKRITDANKFVEGYGFSKEDLIGRNYLDFVVEKYKEKAIEDFEKLRRGIPQEGEFEVITPKGNVTAYYRDNPIVRAGNVIGVQAVLTDITERKRAEDELRKYQVKLKAMASEILKTQERERQRLAIGLHDDICQNLVLTKLTLESSLRLISEAKLAASLKIAAETIGETIRQTESLTFELSNPVLREFGFIAALEKYLATEISGEHGIAFELETDEPLGSLRDDVKTCLFRVTRELLTNVVKHAQARKVKISIHMSQGKIHIIVRDDGVGFESDEIKEKTSRAMRFGLFSVREQLEHLGGHLIIESKPGRGTVATVVV